MAGAQFLTDPELTENSPQNLKFPQSPSAPLPPSHSPGPATPAPPRSWLFLGRASGQAGLFPHLLRSPWRSPPLWGAEDLGSVGFSPAPCRSWHHRGPICRFLPTSFHVFPPPRFWLPPCLLGDIHSHITECRQLLGGAHHPLVTTAFLHGKTQSRRIRQGALVEGSEFHHGAVSQRLWFWL